MRRISVPGMAALLCVVATEALAQADGTPAPSARAQRDAEKVFLRIRAHSDKPRRWGENKDGKDHKEAPARPAVAVAPTRPAPMPVAAAAPPGPASVPVPAAAGPATSPLAILAAGEPAPTSPAAVPAPVLQAAPLVGDEPAPPPSAPAAPQPDAEPDEEALTLVEQVEPRFSSQLMQTLRKGTVQVRFEVRADGSVGQAEVVKSTSARLHGAALAAVAQWRFQPLRKPQTGLVDLSFNLD